MRRAMIAIAGLLLGAMLVGAQEQDTLPPAEYACLYGVSIEVQLGKVIVIWGDPPCNAERLKPGVAKDWVADLKYHCSRLTVYAAKTLGDTPEPVVMGSNCQPGPKQGG